MPSQAVTLVYPSSAADATTSDGIVEDLLTTQDGTFATLSSTFDVSTGSGNLDVDGTSATMMAKVTLENQYAICKFTFTDGSSNITDIKKLYITDYVSGDAIATVTNESGLDGVVYVAMPASEANQKMQFEIYNGSDDEYFYCTGKANANLTASNYYQPTITLTSTQLEGASLSDVSSTVFLGKVIAVNSNNTMIWIFANADVAKAVGLTPTAVIVYVGNDATCDHGLAISLTDVGKASWGPIQSDESLTNCGSLATAQKDMDGNSNTTVIYNKYPSMSYIANITRNYSSTYAVPTGCTGWFVGSAGQWVKIFNQLGEAGIGSNSNFGWFGGSTTYNKIKTALEDAGATMFSTDDTEAFGTNWYWSSSESHGDDAVTMAFSTSKGVRVYQGYRVGTAKSYAYNVRPMLSF